MRYALIGSIIFLSSICYSKEAPNTITEEIEYLLNQVEESSCKFKRNDLWHSGQEISLHMRKKYEYLSSKNKILTTESFILNAASESSSSGKPYEVQCENSAPIHSYIWLNIELTVYRKAKNH